MKTSTWWSPHNVRAFTFHAYSFASKCFAIAWHSSDCFMCRKWSNCLKCHFVCGYMFVRCRCGLIKSAIGWVSGEQLCQHTISIQRVCIEFGLCGYTPVPLNFMLVRMTSAFVFADGSAQWCPMHATAWKRLRSFTLFIGCWGNWQIPLSKGIPRQNDLRVEVVGLLRGSQK